VGVRVALFQPPSLPGGGSGLPTQFVIQTTDPLVSLNPLVNKMIGKAMQTGQFVYLDSDLKYNENQVRITLDRDRIASPYQ